MPALRQRLFLIASTAVAVLGQFGGACGELGQGAAGTCNRASQMVDEHPWGGVSHSPTILLLPGAVSELLNANVVASLYNLMHQAPMQALAMGRELALLVGKPSPRDTIALAVIPAETHLGALLDTALFVVVLRIIGAPLAVQFAFEPPFRLHVELEFLAQGEQSRLGITRHNGDGRGSKIKPDHVRSDDVLGFPVGLAL